MDSYSTTCVSGLFAECDVAAIIGLVIAIYIIALNSQVVSIAIGQRPISERFEFLPFGTNCNSASTVVFICCIRKSIAAGFHALPNAVKPSGFICACHAVFKAGLAELRVMRVLRFGVAGFEATAIGGTAFSKVIGENMTFLAALALAKPEGSASAFLMRTDNGPTVEGLVS